MIPLILADEPHWFDAGVRQKGRAHLATVEAQRTEPLQSKHFQAFWARYTREIHAIYSGICAFTGLYIDFDEKIEDQKVSIDHFRPKVKYKSLAYEWANYRLCMKKINQRKGDSEEIIDPISIPDNFFYLNIDDGSVKLREFPGHETWVEACKTTIDTLGLNNKHLRRRRSQLIQSYRISGDKDELKFRAPFLYYALKYQGVI
ncbi:hypothetical protein VZ95_20340, partial [Elstera litoralis]